MVLFQGGCLRRAYGGEGGMGTKPGLRGGALSAPPGLARGGPAGNFHLEIAFF